MTLRNSETANQFHVQLPMSISGMRRADATSCKGCGGALEEVLFTTFSGGSGPSLWQERPIAVDGFCCLKCGAVAVPRFLEPEEVTKLQDEAIGHGQAGRLDEAEIAFRRVSNSWPRYAPARLNLAALYIARADAEEEDEARSIVVNRCLDTSEAHLRDALRGEQVPLAMALATLVQVLLRREAVGKALEAVEQARSPEHDEATRRAVDELHRYVELRGDLYERGSAILLKRVKLHDRPWSPPDALGRTHHVHCAGQQKAAATRFHAEIWWTWRHPCISSVEPNIEIGERVIGVSATATSADGSGANERVSGFKTVIDPLPSQRWRIVGQDRFDVMLVVPNQIVH